MENDNHRHPRQDRREDYLRHQPLHDHPDLFAAHNRRFAGKKALLSVNSTIKYRERLIESRETEYSQELGEAFCKKDRFRSFEESMTNDERKRAFLHTLYIIYGRIETYV